MADARGVSAPLNPIVKLPNGKEMPRNDILNALGLLEKGAGGINPKAETGCFVKDPDCVPDRWLYSCACQNRSEEFNDKTLAAISANRFKLADTPMIAGFTVYEVAAQVKAGLISESILSAVQIKAIRAIGM